MLPSDYEAEEFIRRRIERLPAPMRASMKWLRRPDRRWVRMPVSVLLICGGLLWFLPLVGLWMLPLGLFLIAEEIPPLKRRLVGALLCLEQRFKQR